MSILLLPLPRTTLCKICYCHNYLDLTIFSLFCIISDGHPDYYGPHGYYDFFPGGQPPPDMQGELGYLTPVSQGGGPLTSLEPPIPHHNLGGLPPEGAQFLPPKDMTPSPEPVPMSGANEVFRPNDRFVPSRGGAHTPGGPPNGFSRTLTHEVSEGVW